MSSKKRKLEKTLDNYGDDFPEEFNICYSSEFLDNKAVEVREIRKEIIKTYYESLNEGKTILKFDFSNYTISAKRLLIEEILNRFPKIIYTISKNQYTLTNTTSNDAMEHSIRADAIIIPLTREYMYDENKMDSYIS